MMIDNYMKHVDQGDGKLIRDHIDQPRVEKGDG